MITGLSVAVIFLTSSVTVNGRNVAESFDSTLGWPSFSEANTETSTSYKSPVTDLEWFFTKASFFGDGINLNSQSRMSVTPGIYTHAVVSVGNVTKDNGVLSVKQNGMSTSAFFYVVSGSKVVFPCSILMDNVSLILSAISSNLSISGIEFVNVGLESQSAPTITDWITNDISDEAVAVSEPATVVMAIDDCLWISDASDTPLLVKGELYTPFQPGEKVAPYYSGTRDNSCEFPVMLPDPLTFAKVITDETPVAPLPVDTGVDELTVEMANRYVSLDFVTVSMADSGLSISDGNNGFIEVRNPLGLDINDGASGKLEAMVMVENGMPVLVAVSFTAAEAPVNRATIDFSNLASLDVEPVPQDLTSEYPNIGKSTVITTGVGVTCTVRTSNESMDVYLHNKDGRTGLMSNSTVDLSSIYGNIETVTLHGNTNLEVTDLSSGKKYGGNGEITISYAGNPSLGVTRSVDTESIAVNKGEVYSIDVDFRGYVTSVTTVYAPDDNVSAEYFTLQGIKVASPLAPGIYIKRHGHDANVIYVR